MIVTTIDVESNSERADSPTFPLLGNMLSHNLNPYPIGFESGLQGTDITINGLMFLLTIRLQDSMQEIHEK